MNNPMTYIQNGDYQIPDLKLSQQPEKPLGKYGRMRKTYLKEHRPILYNQMLLSEKLYPHLIEIDETAQSRLEQMMPQLAKEAGATEELKASDPMKTIITEMDSYAFLRPMAQMIEFRCLKGKVLLSTMELHKSQQYPEVRALQASIYTYLSGENFEPAEEITEEELSMLVRG